MIYLDNCSTTRPREEVVELIYKSLKDNFANPSSLHRLGFNSEKKMKEAREIISNFLKVEAREIFFTSGGTESNNIAIQSMVKKNSKRGKHIITSKIEHPSVLNIIDNYEKIGYEVTYLDNDDEGRIDLNQLEAAVNDSTILISLIHVNNEIGIIQDIEGVREIIGKLPRRPLLHLDGVQSFGKIDFNLKSLKVDSYSFSGHKVYGPKGIGGLYINKDLKLDPIIYGGNQELGLRSGTENLTGIIGFGEAVRILGKVYKEEASYAKELKDYMVKKHYDEISDFKINSRLDEGSSPFILNISYEDIRGEVLLHYLEEKEIYVSTSSACSSKGTEKSHVLRAINLSDNEIEGAIRFCFSPDLSKDDIDYTITAIKDSVGEIRSIIRR